MAVSSKEAIVNLALRRIGQKKISDIDDADDTVAVKANDVYDILRQALLRAYPWNFSKKSAILGRVVDSETTITGATAADPVVITAASHGLSDDDTVSIRGVGGMIELNGKTYTVANATTDTLELEDIDGGDYTAFTSGGTIGKVSVVGDEVNWDNRYYLPSDYLNIWRINGEPESRIKFAIENPSGSRRELLTDEDTCHIKYIFDVEDYELFDETFVKLFALLLASNLAFTVSQSRTLAEDLQGEYEIEFAKAMFVDSSEAGTPTDPMPDESSPIISERS